jgi:hypothetical protein
MTALLRRAATPEQPLPNSPTASAAAPAKLLIAQAVAEAAQNATANQVRYELVPQVKKGQVSAMFEDEAKRWPSALRSWRTG